MVDVLRVASVGIVMNVVMDMVMMQDTLTTWGTLARGALVTDDDDRARSIVDKRFG